MISTSPFLTVTLSVICLGLITSQSPTTFQIATVTLSRIAPTLQPNRGARSLGQNAMAGLRDQHGFAEHRPLLPVHPHVERCMEYHPRLEHGPVVRQQIELRAFRPSRGKVDPDGI